MTTNDTPSTSSYNFLPDLRLLIKIAMPLLLSGFIQSSSPFFATLFLAHLGKNAISAGALVIWLFAALMALAWGLLSATGILVSFHHGAEDPQAVAAVLKNGLILAALISVPAFCSLWYSPYFLLWIGQDPEIIEYAQSYIHSVSWSIPADFFVLVLIQFIVGLGHARTNLVFMALWTPLNILLSYLLVFGKAGLPNLGIAGIGWGMTLSYYLSLVGLILYVSRRKVYQPYLSLLSITQKTNYLTELWRIGYPMGLVFCSEIGGFLLISLLIGSIDLDALAANQIAMQYIGQLAVFIFSMAQAVTVRIGFCMGAGDTLSARRAGYTALFLSFITMLLIYLLVFIFRNALISIDLDIFDPKNQTIVAYARPLLGIAGLFLLMESLRITLFGILRGVKDTKFTFICSFISFWLIPVPVGLATVLVFHYPSINYWWGMVLGSFCGVIVSAWRFTRIL